MRAMMSGNSVSHAKLGRLSLRRRAGTRVQARLWEEEEVVLVLVPVPVPVVLTAVVSQRRSGAS
jgi:hypothetical protein